MQVQLTARNIPQYQEVRDERGILISRTLATARADRIRSASGDRDYDYWQATCDACPWQALAMHSNRTIEGRRLAERDANEHNAEYHS